MADLSSHTNYTGKYSGLLDNLWVTLVIAGACLIGYEIEAHIPRRRGRQGTFERLPVRVFWTLRRLWGEWPSGKRRLSREQGGLSADEMVREKGVSLNDKSVQEEKARKRLGSREGWEFGYIYQPKAWRLNPSPPFPRWPLAWIISSLKVKEREMPDTCGLDITLHMRFLRACFFYVLLQAATVLPILMPLHIFYSPDSISTTSMIRASVSSLVESSGSRWLWVHAVLIWWVTITWTATVIWIVWGALGYRRRELQRMTQRVKASRVDQRRMNGGEDGLTGDDHRDAATVGIECEGVKRFRTVMISNVPPDMRDEDVLRDYYDHYIHLHRVRCGRVAPRKAAPIVATKKHDNLFQRVAFSPRRLLKKQTDRKEQSVIPPTSPTDPDIQPGHSPGQVSEGDNTMVDGEENETWESEVDEVILVRKLGSIASLRARRSAVLRQLEIAHVKLAQRILNAVAKHKTKYHDTSDNRVVIHPAHDIESGLDELNAARDKHLPDEITKAERMERLVQALGGFVGEEPEQLGRGEETVWDVLHALPRELIDPYQSLTHLTSLFRDQNAPLIDYLTTKLGYLTLLLDEARDKPLSSYSASSAAFVTFRDARTARLVLKILDSHPKRSLACHATVAPDWTNIIWPRLGKSVYRSEFVRGWVVYLGVWAFTLVWIFPVSLLTALSSLTNIAGFIKPLQDFLDKHPTAASAITSLAPVILVAGLTIAICPILLVIANKAETIYTRLGVHNSVLERFWKFLMVNGVVFFAIGQSAIEAYLTAFQTNSFDPLPIVASAFPTAAPYFASYILLQIAIQPYFEIFRFGLPTIVYVFGTRVSIIPRQRNSRTAFPTFSHFSQLPQQLLTGAIMHLFMLLNPLVIPFALLYYGMCYIVWKRQFTYVYGRLYENNGRRSSIRILRYSLDALALAQFVLFAFFILNKAKGHAGATGTLFFLTLICKLIMTRAVKRRFDNLDIEEADLFCPPVPHEQDASLGPMNESIEDWTPLTSAATSTGAHTSAIRSRFSTVYRQLATWYYKWGYAGTHRNAPAGYRKPIPFDHLLFAWLDEKFQFETKDTANPTIRRSDQIMASESDAELRHEPDHAIFHRPAQKVVIPHHPLRSWEDIPPYQRSRGYNDQPAYTDDYDDFMWLPRDPLSTLDLDDTVEMRLALTTSAGGSGRIGDWPPHGDEQVEVDEEEEEDQVYGEEWQEVTVQRDSMRPHDTGLPLFPPTSDRRLNEQIALSPYIGSEVDEGTGTALMRRGTKRVGEGLSSLFKRPRSGTNQTYVSSGFVSMRTLSISSDPSNVMGGQVDPIQEVSAPISPTRPPMTAPARSTSTRMTGQSGTDDSLFLSPTRTSTSRPIGPRQDSEEIEVLDLGSPTRDGTRMSSLSVQLGRSPSGRRPSRLRAISRTSDHRLPSLAPSLSPSISRSGGRGRDRSTSVLSAQQQALMNEVMHEERLASKDLYKEEKEARDKEKEELMKEREKARRSSRMEEGMGGLGRSNSRMNEGGVAGFGRSMSGMARPGSGNGNGHRSDNGNGIGRSISGVRQGVTWWTTPGPRTSEFGLRLPRANSDGSNVSPTTVPNTDPMSPPRTGVVDHTPGENVNVGTNADANAEASANTNTHPSSPDHPRTQGYETNTDKGDTTTPPV